MTAALATGDGPGLTAAPTTAALATGARTTPTRPTLAARSISVPFFCEFGVGFDLGGSLEGGDDVLRGDAPIGDELPARAPCGSRERCRPEVLVHEHAGDAAR